MSDYKAIFNITFTQSKAPAWMKGNRRAEYKARRKFYNMTSSYNYFTYTLNGKKCAKNATAEKYFTKNGAEDKATGLFGLDKIYTSDDLTKLKEELKNTKSIIWHGFISFDQETSKYITTLEQAQKFMHQTFGSFLQRSHLKKDNIVVGASLHVDRPNHHHIHFFFYEKEPKRRDKNGVLGYTKKGTFSQECIDEFVVSMNMRLDEEFNDYYIARDEAITSLKVAKGKILTQPKHDVVVSDALSKLAKKLPKQGRLQYNAENMKELRTDIDNIVQLLLVTDQNAYETNKKTLDKIAKIRAKEVSNYGYANSFQSDITKVEAQSKAVRISSSTYAERLENDYKARLGNIVLSIAKQLKKGEIVERQRKMAVNDKQAKITARRNLAFKNRLLSNAIKMFNVPYDVRVDYSQSVAEIERENYGKGGSYNV